MFRSLRRTGVRPSDWVMIATGYSAAIAVTITTWIVGMRSGIRALNDLSN
jgi:hypothetical protein